MILSVSRRTDIPAFYSDWFINRIRQEYVLVRNPMNHKQVSKIKLSPSLIDCIVFWTKNAIPLMKHLNELNNKGYIYFFQYTLTPYNNTIEKYLPNKSIIIKNIQTLSKILGKNKIIWRYDPIFINEEYTIEKHAYYFEKFCNKLANFVNYVTISFLDKYKKNKNINLDTPDINTIYYISDIFGKIARKYNLTIKTCAEPYNLSEYGIYKGACIDKYLLEQILHYPLNIKKSIGQRTSCLCYESIDIGTYSTCQNGCIYCYATNKTLLKNNINLYNKIGEILCDTITSKDIIKERFMQTLKNNL